MKKDTMLSLIGVTAFIGYVIYKRRNPDPEPKPGGVVPAGLAGPGGRGGGGGGRGGGGGGGGGRGGRGGGGGHHGGHHHGGHHGHGRGGYSAPGFGPGWGWYGGPSETVYVVDSAPCVDPRTGNIMPREFCDRWR